MAPPGSQDQPPPDASTAPARGCRCWCCRPGAAAAGSIRRSSITPRCCNSWKSAFRCMNPTSAPGAAPCAAISPRRSTLSTLTAKRCRTCPPPVATPPMACASARNSCRRYRCHRLSTSVCPTNVAWRAFPRAALPAARRGHRRGRTAPRDAEPVQYRRAGSGVSRLRSARSGADPRRFTVEAGKAVSDDWQTEDEYHLWLLGPNGFHRELRGALNRPQPEVRLRPTGRSLQLQLNNPGTEAIAVTLERCPYTQQGPWHITLPAGGSHQQRFDARASGGWYDLTLQSPGGWLPPGGPVGGWRAQRQRPADGPGVKRYRLKSRKLNRQPLCGAHRRRFSCGGRILKTLSLPHPAIFDLAHGRILFHCLAKPVLLF